LSRDAARAVRIKSAAPISLLERMPNIFMREA